MAARSSRSKALPRHGRAQVSVTVRDANGFLHHYGDIDTSVGAVQEAIALLQLHSAEMDAAQRGTLTA
ncbi:hypothetical protein QL996_05890 [Planococcus sp. APC 4015]|nr:hypothetical protein [Planococcus sp. APC 4015]